MQSAGASITLSTNVENLRLIGTAAINGNGNTLANILLGNCAANRLDGGGGGDRLTGGLGNDVFAFSTALGSGNVDRIVDFANASGNNDVFQLAQSILVNVGAAGALSAAAFKNLDLGTIDADDRILYDQDQGDLLYDRDGSGTQFQAIQFAEIDNHLALTASDFLVA